MALPVLLLWASSLVCGVLGSDAYDVIVVGSGPGGLVAAEYLTRQSDVSVLLLEAGNVSLQNTGGTDVLSYSESEGWTKFDIPGEFDNTIYNTENEEYRADWVNLSSVWLGKLLGGCSSINAVQYFRTPDSYLTKASWPYSADVVNSGFEAVEELSPYTETPSADGEYYLLEAFDIVSSALEGVGYASKTLNDESARNSKNNTYGHPPYTIKGGLRDSPAKTFYSEMEGRNNFKLLVNSKALYIQQMQGNATGVVYRSEAGDKVELALTDRGVVVVAAGALGTPQLLMQSGIGPQDQLEALAGAGSFSGVGDQDTWVVNEAVGKSVFDAAVVYASFTHSGMVPFLNTKRPEDAIAQFVKNQTGPWAIPGPVLTAYETMEISGREYEFQTTVLPHGFGDAYETDEAYTLALLINNPESRDYISVDGNAFNVATNGSWYLSTSGDVEAMETYAAKMVSTMTDAGSVFLGNASGSGDVDIASWVTENAGSVSHHFGGSCYTAADDADDASRCADASFRVIGTQNVYISDASLMKEGTVNPYAFVMYIGHQAAKNVLEAAFGVSADTDLKTGSSSSSGDSSAANGVLFPTIGSFVAALLALIVL
ncbi:putative carbohydrate-binding protein [Phytophthora cinnamomi]|uniref:putative carbohydrate-binding protein n=1 Tax=Phytophthora cinnamomi TaxID=4785 RepID=UPI003559DBFF|nr:putative carbohydrate-binding protein [Phytophthora cinnamomi]